MTPPVHPQQTESLTIQEIGALSMALSGTVEYEEGNAIPQATWNSIYERRLVTLHTDISGEAYTHVTDEGRAALMAALTGERPC
jgi:hypothetical protein